MRVSILTRTSRKAGGLFYSVRETSRELMGRGVSVTVISPTDEFTNDDLPEWKGIDCVHYKARTLFEFCPNLHSIIARTRPDVLHVQGIWTYSQWAAMRVQARADIPVVVSPRGMLDPWALANSAVKKKLARLFFADRALARTSCFHALADSEAASIRSICPSAPIAVVPNGVRLPDLSGVKRVQNPRRRLLFLGRLHPKKGLYELIQAFTRLRPSIELIVAGWDDGGHEPHLRKLAAGSSGLSFVGPKFGAEKAQLLRSVDGFILPSLSEGLPMSVLEAWSYGLPVYMSEHCNIPIGFERQAAIEVKPERLSIESALRHFEKSSGSELASIGTRGLELVKQRFSWERVGDDLAGIYRWACGHGADTPPCMRDGF